MTRASAISSIALIVACGFMLAATGLARSGPAEDIESQKMFMQNPNIGACLGSLLGVQGCFQEVISSLFTFRFQGPGPACCKAFVAIDDNCLLNLFPLNPLLTPLNPFFPPFMLKNYCKTIVGGSVPPPPPPPPTKKV